jgi:pilus assembly protein Flp/PilA
MGMLATRGSAMTKFFKLLSDRRGAAGIEYAVVAALIAVAARAGYKNLGAQVKSTFNNVAENVDTSL